MMQPASRLKAHAPSMITLFGGIHATLRCAALLQEHAAIDYSLLGGTEETFPVLIDDLGRGGRGGAEPSRIPGLVHRRNGRVETDPVARARTF